MTSRTVPIDAVLHDYLMKIGVTEHPVMQSLREYTATHRMAKMQIAPEQGQFMSWLTHLLGVRRYLEIGVFTGYSSLAVALSMPEDGYVVACDVSEEFTTIAKDYWQQAGVSDRIELMLQPAILTLQSLIEQGRQGSFDLVFIDADKPAYFDYFELCLQLVKTGGVIAIDNIFLSGRVVSPQESDPKGVHMMHKFNQALIEDSRVKTTVLPIGDGLTLCTKL